MVAFQWEAAKTHQRTKDKPEIRSMFDRLYQDIDHKYYKAGPTWALMGVNTVNPKHHYLVGKDMILGAPLSWLREPDTAFTYSVGSIEVTTVRLSQ